MRRSGWRPRPAPRAMTDSGGPGCRHRRVGDSGPLDVLVVNAGDVVFGNPLELDPDAIDRMIGIKVARPTMPRSRQPAGCRRAGGSSSSARSTATVPPSRRRAYAMSKSALQGMARGLARDFGPRGITVNVVQPGPIDTDMNPADGPLRELLHSHGVQAPWAAGGNRRHGRLAGGAGGGLRDRRDAYDRRRLRRLGDLTSAVDRQSPAACRTAPARPACRRCAWRAGHRP